MHLKNKDNESNKDKDEKVSKVEEQTIFDLPIIIVHTSSTHKYIDGKNSNDTVPTLGIGASLNNNTSICSNYYSGKESKSNHND